jgi:KDO2-lipid IV(A) lauroyltransferase
MSPSVRRSNGNTAGHFDFLHREYTPFQRAYMALLNALVAAVGFTLKLGGRPLKNLLILGFGRTAYWLLTERRRIALTNLDLVYGDDLNEADKRRLALKAFQHYVRFTLDFLFDDLYWPLSERREQVTVRNTEALDLALKEGRGFVALSGHLGNFELGMSTINAFGYETFGIYKRFKNPSFDRFIGRKRLRCGYRLVEVPRKEHEVALGVRRRLPRRSIRPELEKIWQSNHGVAVGVDQYGGSGALKIPFLGVPNAPTTVGALRYAVENKVPLTLQTCVYGNEDRLIWNIEGPILIEDQPGGGAATLEHYARLVNEWLSEQIKRYPEQYAWPHRRFAHHYYKSQRPVRPDPPQPTGQRDTTSSP